MPKVSVIVPIYNAAEYINKCVESLLKQTLEDIEYIFINDCSTDNTMELLSNILKNYPNRVAQVKIINMEVNSGQAKVRTKGIECATGDYIIHCDSDDWVDSNMYRDMYYSAINNRSDIVCCDYYITNGISKTRVLQPVSDKGLFDDMLNNRAHWSLCNKLIKRDLYYSNDISYPEGNMGEDMVLSLQAAYYAQSVSYINNSFYYYFYNTESITKKTSTESYLKKWEHSSKNVDIVCNFLNKFGLSDFYSDSIIWLKFASKWYLAPIVNNGKYYKMWFSAYKEINSKVLSSSIISFSNKLGYLMTFLRLYPYLKK